LTNIIARLSEKLRPVVEDDALATLKTYVLNAALKQGLSQDTVVTAPRRWGPQLLVCHFEPKESLPTARLYFDHHIGKVPECQKCREEGFQDSLERVKWTLWHGKLDEALAKLAMLMKNITDTKKRSKLEAYNDYF